MVVSGSFRALRGQRAQAMLVATLLLGPTGSALQAQETAAEVMRFAAEMAKRGSWREARFRWETAARLDPGNPKILNNLGVAHEALGQVALARESYARALAGAAGNTIIATNRQRAQRFWAQVEQRGDGDVPTYDLAGVQPGDPEGVGAKPHKGKSFKVTVKLPVPARLDLTGKPRLLVASFLTDESDLLDVNREFVRFLRSEYHKHTVLDVLEVTPAPAVPEQTLDDLIENREFWKYLGREYSADVIVSGIMKYDRRDSSGFRDVDVVSPSTGQKVRQSQFVEQEQFSYELDVIFMDGATGTLLFRDRLQRSVLYRGTQNDPITAFFELSDTIAPDLLAIVESRTREDVRFVFKK